MAAPGRRELGGAADLERELAESRAREAALSEILAVISRTTTDLEPVFETILKKTLELAGADTAAIQLRKGTSSAASPEWAQRSGSARLTLRVIDAATISSGLERGRL